MNLIFALTGDFFANSRAIRQVNALAEHGVTGLLLHYSNPDRPSAYRGFTVSALPWPNQRGPRFFARIHKEFVQRLGNTSPTVVHASDLYSLAACAKTAHTTGAKLVFDSRELYHHVAGIRRKPLSKLFWHQYQAHYLPKCDLVITVSDSIADRLHQQYRIKRPVVIPNVSEFAAPTTIQDIKSACNIPKSSFVVLHQGHARPERGCDLLIESLAFTRPEVHAVFLGKDQTNGALRQLSVDRAVQNRVHFLPPVPPTDLLGWTASADVGVSLLKNSCLNHDFALPNKFFEYMAAGTPVIATNRVEIARIVNSFDVGLICEFNPNNLAKMIDLAYNDQENLTRWKRNTASVVSAYDWNSISKSFISAYSSVLDG